MSLPVIVPSEAPGEPGTGIKQTQFNSLSSLGETQISKCNQSSLPSNVTKIVKVGIRAHESRPRVVLKSRPRRLGNTRLATVYISAISTPKRQRTSVENGLQPRNKGRTNHSADHSHRPRGYLRCCSPPRHSCSSGYRRLGRQPSQSRAGFPRGWLLAFQERR